MTKNKKIIAIATNCGPEMPYGNTGLWLSELTHFLDVMVEAGYQVDLASPSGGKIPLDVNSTTPSQLKDEANVRFLNNPQYAGVLENSRPVAEIQALVLAAVREWSGSGQEDDMTLMLVRDTDWKPGTNPNPRQEVL